MDLGDRSRVDVEPRSRPFQFSLRTMFVVVTVVAVLCGGLFGPWVWLRDLTLFYFQILAPMAIVVALIYGRGYARTFWIGTVFMAGIFWLEPILHSLDSSARWEHYAAFRCFDVFLPSYSPFAEPYIVRWQIVLRLCAAIGSIVASGLIAIVVRWMVESPRRTQAQQATTDAPQIVDDREAK